MWLFRFRVSDVLDFGCRAGGPAPGWLRHVVFGVLAGISGLVLV